MCARAGGSGEDIGFIARAAARACGETASDLRAPAKCRIAGRRNRVDTLGLFTGAEFAEENDVPLPPQIILFLENIWGLVETDEKHFCDEVRTTYLHELGHYLGLDEEELTERGLE